jgi:hypothetical protein
MDEMQQKLNSILGNPEMMSQIMNMAQALGADQEPEPVSQPVSAPSGNPLQSALGGIDPGTIQKIIGIAQQAGIDQNQQNLLKALRPYLSEHRIIKLEKAMRAAKIAGVATTALGGMGSIFLPGR